MWLDRIERTYKLNIGVRKNAARELEAHAWLTSGDHVVTGNLPDLKAFSPIPLESGIETIDWSKVRSSYGQCHLG